MSYIPITGGKVKTFPSDEGGETVSSQAVVTVDASGAPIELATQTTLAALKAAVDTLSAKIDACNTGAVRLDGTTLAALESINAAISGTVAVLNFPVTQAVSGTVAVSNFPVTQAVDTGLEQPLTNTQLRASAVPVSVSNFPAGAATENTLSGLSGKVPALEGGRIPVALPSGAAGLTDDELRATPVPVNVPGVASETTLAAIEDKLPALSGGRIPVVLPAGGGGLTDVELRATPVPVSCTDLATLLSSLHAEDTPHASGEIGQLLLGIRWDSDMATADNGDYTVLKIDEAGRLKVSTMPASYAAVTGNVTSATSTVFIDCTRFSNLMIHCSGTFAGANCTFEGSLNSTNGTDGNWFTVQAIRSNANTIETATGALSAAPAYAWELSVNALKYFRIRATAWTSGSQVWTLVPGTYATEPIPGAQISGTQPVSGTVTANQATPTASNLSSAATTNATAVKTSAGTLYNVAASNTGAAAAYLKFYNKASAPTVGTDVPVLTLPIPAGGAISIPFGSLGHRFATGIGLAITGAAADNDTTAVAAAQVKVLTGYV